MRNTHIQMNNFYTSEVMIEGDVRSDMRKRRNANRERLLKGLSDNKKPTPIGSHTQGSYAMRTMVKDASNDYDIDDGVYFKKSDLVGDRDGEMSALAVRQMVCEALQDDKFSTAPEVLKNCVRVYYNEGFHVDVPSYRRIEEKNPFDGKVVCKYELASSDWKASDAKSVTTWFSTKNKNLSPDKEDSEKQFRRVVTLLKKFSKSRGSWKPNIATGFMITKLVADNFVSSLQRDDYSFRETAKAIKECLSNGTKIKHPTLDENITRDEDGRPGYLLDRLTENLKHLSVLDESGCSHTDAMAAWDKFFAVEWFSKQPDPTKGSGSSGGSTATILTPTAPVEKKGGGRYAQQ